MKNIDPMVSEEDCLLIYLLTLAVYQEALYSVVTSSPGYSSCHINTEWGIMTQ